jgi:hypothetical protein
VLGSGLSGIPTGRYGISQRPERCQKRASTWHLEWERAVGSPVLCLDQEDSRGEVADRAVDRTAYGTRLRIEQAKRKGPGVGNGCRRTGVN